MADEDEIDILGDFSFNSCFAQNNQGIPSCSDREDTVHPQWLLDSTVNNWYDKDVRYPNRSKNRKRLIGNEIKLQSNSSQIWNEAEKVLLAREIMKYGRNVHKIAQTIKTKTEAEIQALIEAEYGINLDTPAMGLDKHEEHDDTPTVVQEEIVTDDNDVNTILNMVATGSPTVSVPKHPFRKKGYKCSSMKSLLRPDILLDTKKTHAISINPSDILYEDDLIIGSTESIGTDVDAIDKVAKKLMKNQKNISEKKNCISKRKVNRNKSKPVNKIKDVLNSPPGRHRKDSSLSEDNTKSPKIQIVLGSGQSLPVSEGEQIIKIEKKKDSDPESDVDIDSDNEGNTKCKDYTETESHKLVIDEGPIAVPLRKFEPMRKRQKKINLDGGGGCTIMHTDSGDLYEISSEPRKERQPRKQQIHLIQCRVYNSEKPAPYEVRLHVSALLCMDAHAHTSRGEVMGLVGGATSAGGCLVTLAAYKRAAAASARTHCDMDPVSQASAAEHLRRGGHAVMGWHHSHPQFPCAPSRTDLRTQHALQLALNSPFIGIITSQNWPTGRTASQFRCIRIEDDIEEETPVGYQFSVKLVPDLSADTLSGLLGDLREVLLDTESNELSVNMPRDVCPQAGITYLEKLISSSKHHMRSAGYSDDDSVVKQLLQGIRDVFR